MLVERSDNGSGMSECGSFNNSQRKFFYLIKHKYTSAVAYLLSANIAYQHTGVQCADHQCT